MPRTQIPIGERFGSWVVTGPREARGIWCRCDCGTTRLNRLDRLKSGYTTHCGCLNVPEKVPVGSRFHYWEVISGDEIRDKKKRLFLCRCVCGTERYVALDLLKDGRSKCCGCVRKPPTQHPNPATPEKDPFAILERIALARCSKCLQIGIPVVDKLGYKICLYCASKSSNPEIREQAQVFSENLRNFSQKESRHTWTPLEVKQCAELLQEGKTPAEVALRTGIPQAKITAKFRAQGTRMRNPSL